MGTKSRSKIQVRSGTRKQRRIAMKKMTHALAFGILAFGIASSTAVYAVDDYKDAAKAEKKADKAEVKAVKADAKASKKSGKALKKQEKVDAEQEKKLDKA